MDAKVRDVMTPGPIGVDYNQSIGEAARTMRDLAMQADPASALATLSQATANV